VSFVIAWNETIPIKDSTARDLDVYIRDLKIALRERLAVEHSFSVSESGITHIGQHKKGSARINFGPASEKPPVNANNPGQIYIIVNSTVPYKVQFDDGTDWVEIGYLQINDLDTLNAHLEDEDNPHNVTAEQVGGAPLEHSHVNPVGSLGLLYPTLPFDTVLLTRLSTDGDSGQWLTIGPTDSGATVICTVLDVVPAESRGILIQGYIESIHDSTRQLAGAQAMVRPVGSEAIPEGFLYNYSYAPSETLRVTSDVAILIDSNRIFEFRWQKTAPFGSGQTIKLYYGGYFV